MPGLLSNVFGGDENGENQTSQDTQSYDAAGDAGIELSPTVSVSHDASGSYQNPDGSTGEWSSHEDITLTVDADAALGVVGGIEQMDSSDA